MDAVFVLVHSPSVGPSTWAPVAKRLAVAGAAVVVPSLIGVGDGWPPFWPRVAEVVGAEVARLLFGPPYEEVADETAARGWVVGRIPGLHLHQIVDPDAVIGCLAAMAGPWSPS